MKFNICLGNLYSPVASRESRFMMLAVFSDTTRYLKLALEEAGHEVMVSSSYVDKTAINLFWERFRYQVDGEDDPPIKLRKMGYRFGMICTEPLAMEGAYNPFEFQQKSEAAEIYGQFATAAKAAEFVWYMLPEAGPVCKKLNGNSHLVRFGHVASFRELISPERRVPIIDFISQGSVTDRRAQIGNELRNRGFKFLMEDFQPDFMRNGMLEQARICLSMQKTDGHSIFSLGRIPHAIHNQVPLVVEYAGEPNYLSPYCVVAPPETFVEVCCDLARSPDLKPRAAATLERFARELPMTPIIEGLIADTFPRSV